MKLERASGILLHLTSLPGHFGIGDLGPESRWFADLLTEAKQKVWSILPFGPPDKFFSPYQSCSAFAGNHLLISPEELVSEGYLAKKDLQGIPKFPANRVDYAAVAKYKDGLLRKSFLGFSESNSFNAFFQENA